MKTPQQVSDELIAEARAQRGPAEALYMAAEDWGIFNARSLEAQVLAQLAELECPASMPQTCTSSRMD